MATVNRISGMNSGLDTDSLVKVMTANQQSKIDLLLAKKTKAEWKTAQITENNNFLRTIKDDFMSVLGSKSVMKAEAYNTYNVTGLTNPAVSVKATTGVTVGMHSIEVKQIAAAAKVQGDRFAVTGTDFSTAGVTLQNIADGSNHTAHAPLEFVDLGETDADGNAVQGVHFEINGKSFTFKSTDKITNVMDTINKSGAGVKMSYSQLTGAFSIESTSTGKNSKLSIEENSLDGQQSNFFSALGMSASPTAGTDAQLVIDGVEVTRDSNNFTIEGMQFNITGTTSEALTFNVSRNASSAVANVKAFVDQINDLLGKLDGAYRQKPNSAYSPLTDEKRESLSEKEVEAWEAEAKKGILYRDDGVGKLIEQLRTALTSSIDGLGKLADFGITTNGYVAGQSFRLTINEEKLTAALDSNPEGLYNLMSQASNKATSTKAASQGGILARVSAAMDVYTSNTKSYDIQNLNNNIYDYTKRIKEQKDKMADQQERLYLKFAAFEESMSKLNSQQNSFSSYGL